MSVQKTPAVPKVIEVRKDARGFSLKIDGVEFEHVVLSAVASPIEASGHPAITITIPAHVVSFMQARR